MFYLNIFYKNLNKNRNKKKKVAIFFDIYLSLKNKKY